MRTFQTFKALRKEILSFNPDLDIKPSMICRNDLGVDLSEEWNQFEDNAFYILHIRYGLEQLVSDLSKRI